MDNLKMKVTLGSFVIELDGPSEKVKEQFDDLKANGLGQMIDQLTPYMAHIQPAKNPESPSPKNLIAPPMSTSDFPTIQELVMRSLPKSETEWVLAYSFYLKSDGKDTFTRDDLIRKYEESRRKSSSNLKNLTQSIKVAVGKTWIKPINDTDFILLPDGETAALEIFNRTKPAIARQPRKKLSKTILDEKTAE